MLIVSKMQCPVRLDPYWSYYSSNYHGPLGNSIFILIGFHLCNILLNRRFSWSNATYVRISNWEGSGCTFFTIRQEVVFQGGAVEWRDAMNVWDPYSSSTFHVGEDNLR